MTAEPRQLIERLEALPSLPAGSAERLSGYGVMGLPFRSGHILAMRRFTASSLGPSHTSVWHRRPDGEWIFYTDISPGQSCPRFFGADALDAIETKIDLEWSAPSRLRITIPGVGFEWEITAASSTATRFMNAVGRLLPSSAMHRPAVLRALSLVAGPLLGVGRIGLQGTVPNGQRFVANPRVMWTIAESRARLSGDDFGPPGSVKPQARLGDFWIPQRGILAIGEAYFETFEPTRHSSRTARSATAA
jgi:hypothetical protein